MDASTEENIQQSLMQLARLLQVEENVDSVKLGLDHASEAWLLVFDNADDLLSATDSVFAGGKSRRCHHEPQSSVSALQYGGLPTRRATLAG